MTDTARYKNVSLLHKTYDKLKFICQNLIEGDENDVSLSKGITILVNNKYLELKNGKRKKP